LAVDRNALRRLRSLLNDEEYGPKLARLRGTDERRVLDLVSEGRGREARAAINDADQRRLERERESRRRTLYRRAVDNVYRQHAPHGATRGGVEKWLSQADQAELRFAAGATRDQLVQRARQPPKTLGVREVNAFWYH
jgi:hypothetical protein